MSTVMISLITIGISVSSLILSAVVAVWTYRVMRRSLYERDLTTREQWAETSGQTDEEIAEMLMMTSSSDFIADRE